MFNRTTSTLGALCPVEYRLDRKYIGFAVKLFHGARIIFYPIFDPYRAKTAKIAKNEIRISNIEIRNNIKIRMTKIPNCLVNCFEHLYFGHYNLFRISDFVLRNSKNWFRAPCFKFAFLFNLFAFARVIFSPIP